ncbi:MAG: dephospho-CoA kinase, partial [Eggerthellaceae bacterium]|nr:dephospho-CoA kinase [Eggerthellaceae bacterium]
EVILREGKLAQAMRASMAIPGVFKPVDRGGCKLVDGGMLNNLPVDVCREMGADIVIAVLAPLEVRIERAVASGFDEADVRRRIAQQITDAERIEQADVVFNNDGTKEELYNKVVNWWNEYNAAY